MESILHVNIYGLKARIRCHGPEEERDAALLLSLFLVDNLDEVDATLDFKKRERPQEIGGLLFSHLAAQGVWALHSGGFHFHGGHLTVGPSDCGKSTFSHMAFLHGFDLLSDDITLLRETPEGVELLPLYPAIYLKDGVVLPERTRYQPAMLKFLLLPKARGGAPQIKEMKKRIEVLRSLTPQVLWSYHESEQDRQKRLIEILCHYPAYEVYWNRTLYEDHVLFRSMLDEIVQSAG